MDQLVLNDPYMKAKYCGTVFDNINSGSNIVYVRFYAEHQAIKGWFEGEGSKFSATFTAMRAKKDETKPCEEVIILNKFREY